MSWEQLEQMIDSVATLLFAAEPSGPYDPKRAK
jgi:hypothetical protein